MFGDNFRQKLAKLVLRNEIEINRERLSNLICHDKEMCKHFLLELVKRKHGAPVDELIRQIFYFINIKVSDKIYSLFETLAEVYVPETPFNQHNFFTYAYFVVMIVTEVNNDSVTEKPTFNKVLQRVEQFSPELSRNHAHLLSEMLQRVTKCPFNQNSRGILWHYQAVPLQLWESASIYPQELIITNWERIYECALNDGLSTIVLYQICTMVSQDAAICQSFLRLLVDKLSEGGRDSFLPGAISNIIELQPNSAGNLWKPIIEEALFGQDGLDVRLILQNSVKLTGDNFYHFTKAFCGTVLMADRPDLYLSLVENNTSRIGMISQLLIANYEKSSNYYLQLQVVKTFGTFLAEMKNAPEELTVIVLQMLRSVPVLSTTQGLVFEVLSNLNWDNMLHPAQLWNVVSHKCLEMKSESRVVIIERLMKTAKHCEAYQSYLIQKTLNCHRKELISQ